MSDVQRTHSTTDWGFDKSIGMLALSLSLFLSSCAIGDGLKAGGKPAAECRCASQGCGCERGE